MHCPDDSEVAALVAGNAALTIRHAFEDHVDECDACRALMVGLVKESFAWKPGARIGRYVIRERIAAGAMGAVYRADDLDLARPIALKRLHADDVRAHGRLLREARSAAQLQHPNVVAVYEVIEDPPCLAMELVEGVTLTEWLHTKREWNDVVAMLAQAGRGLAAAHARGLIHGDFKPDNVLIDGDGRARVADFGLANVNLSGVADAATKLARATATGAGTPAYMAPELVNGELPDARSDLYAFAITAFEALHGEHPFAGATAEAMWSEMALGRVRAGKRRVPAWLDRRVRKGLAVEPEDRWVDVGAFVDALEARPTYPKWIAVGGAVIAAAGIALALAPAAKGGDDCGDGLVDGLWSAPVHASMRDRFLAVRPHAAVSLDSATRGIDDWSNAWKLGRRAACSVPEAERSPRIACLNRQLDALRAQLAVWQTPDPRIVDNVVRATEGLGSPAECVGAPDVAMVDPGVDALAGEVNALVRSGKPRAALPKIEPMLAVAKATGHPRDLAVALMAAENTERDIHDLEHARAHIAEASRQAGRAGDDAMVIEAMMLEASVTMELGRARDTLGMLDAADALDARTGQHRAPDIAVIRSEALIELGDGADALAILLPVVPVFEARASQNPRARRALSGMYAKLAGAESSLDRRDAAHETMLRVVAVDTELLGPDHPEVGKSLHDLAQTELALQDHPSAHAHLDRAIAILRAAYGDHNALIGYSHVTAGKLAVYEGKLDLARSENLAALDALTGELPPDHPAFAEIETNLGELDRNAEHYKEAIPHYERALRIFDKSGHDPKSHATTLTSLGACYAQTEQLAAARLAFERAIREITDGHFDKMWLAEPYTGLATIDEAEGHVADALAHDRDALAALEGRTTTDVEAMRQAILQQMADLKK